MIHVDRSLFPCPSILVMSGKSPAWSEYKNAELFFGRDRERNRQKRFPFKVYKRPEVRDAVGTVFSEKCAYCEVVGDWTYPMDVETFRPRSAVVESPEHTGYWWLAMHWENLLLSCVDCSRSRNTEGVKTGKANRFPIENEANRVFGPPANPVENIIRDINQIEHPILLDPCVDDPTQHLVFDEKTGTVSGITGRGSMTMATLSLNRPDLVRRRLERAQGVYTLLRSIYLYFVGPNYDTNSLARNEWVSTLEKSVTPAADFTGLCRQMLVPFMKGSFGEKQLELLNGYAVVFGDTPIEGNLMAAENWPWTKVEGFPNLTRSAPSSEKKIIDAGIITVDQRTEASIKVDIKYAPSMPTQEEIEEFKRQAKTETQKFDHDQSTYSLDNKAGRDTFMNQRRNIEQIAITNIRAIGQLDLDLRRMTPPASTNIAANVTANVAANITQAVTPLGAPWMMLLGENGTGKSTALQAVTLALIGKDAFIAALKKHGLHPRDFLRFGRKRGSVSVKISGFPAPHTLVFNSDSVTFTSPTGTKTKVVYNENGSTAVTGSGWDAQMLIASYGATRLPAAKKSVFGANKFKYTRVDNLFNPFEPMVDAEEWLLYLTRDAFDRAAMVLLDLIPVQQGSTLLQDHEKKRILLVEGKQKTPFRRLSDGYQGMIATTVDILRVLYSIWKNLTESEAVVLLDELGAHLHPRWKMRVVQSLRTAFPLVQFIVTTHDPLCLRGLEQGEIAILRRDEDNHVVALTDLPSPADFRLEQLLTSDFFDLNTTADQLTESRLDRYYALLALKQPTAAESAEITALKTELEKHGLMGSTLRDHLMYFAVDKLVAQKKKDPLIPVAELEQRAVDDISAIWNSTPTPEPKPRPKPKRGRK